MNGITQHDMDSSFSTRIRTVGHGGRNLESRGATDFAGTRCLVLPRVNHCLRGGNDICWGLHESKSHTDPVAFTKQTCGNEMSGLHETLRGACRRHPRFFFMLN